MRIEKLGKREIPEDIYNSVLVRRWQMNFIQDSSVEKSLKGPETQSHALAYGDQRHLQRPRGFYTPGPMSVVTNATCIRRLEHKGLVDPVETRSDEGDLVLPVLAATRDRQQQQQQQQQQLQQQQQQQQTPAAVLCFRGCDSDLATRHSLRSDHHRSILYYCNSGLPRRSTCPYILMNNSLRPSWKKCSLFVLPILYTWLSSTHEDIRLLRGVLKNVYLK
jgi:hypothetical protein